MISDFDRSLGSRYFLNVANERTCFASCASAFKSSGLKQFAIPGEMFRGLYGTEHIR